MLLLVISRGLFISLYLISLLCVLHPELRKALQNHFSRQYRHVLSTVSGPLLQDFGRAKVVKIKTHEGLFLELYGQRDGAMPLLDRIKLADRRDAFFNFGGLTTNLFLHDVDGDQILDIVAPSFDESLVAHLNVYTVNRMTSKLEPKPATNLNK